MNINDLISITSAYKSVNKARVDGKLNLSILALFNLYKYYIEYTDHLEDIGITLYQDTNKKLKREIAKLKYKYPEAICNYKTVVDNIGNPTPTGNTAPTVSSVAIQINENQEYSFTIANFTNNFFDAEGDSWSTVIIYPSTLTDGQLFYNNVLVTNQMEIPVSAVVNLKYVRNNELAFNDDLLRFKISDTNVNRKYSALTDITISGTNAEGNQPPTIGDNTIYRDNRAVTVLTLDMFTSQLKPPYNDPENDDIDAIRLDVISNANVGTFLLNGVPVVEGQIITREDLAAGLFTHVAPDQDAISTDNFSFSARDEGSLIWVTE